jgi:hypothetical protein
MENTMKADIATSMLVHATELLAKLSIAPDRDRKLFTDALRKYAADDDDGEYAELVAAIIKHSEELND